MKRVAITGMGVISPLGNDIESFFSNLQSGRSAVERLSGPAFERLASPIGARVSFDGAAHFPGPKLRMLDRASQFALVAAGQALQHAGLELEKADKSRCGVSFGIGMGGSNTTDDFFRALYADNSDRVVPFTVLMGMSNAAGSWIGLDYGLSGPNLTYSTACSSSTVAIGEAWRRIQEGSADVMFSGGTEAPLTFGMLKAWEALRTLAPEDPQDAATSCKPFSKNRSGLVLGEGAAVVILEEWEHAVGRGATIHAELVGYGLSTDCAHITRPSLEGQAQAMQAALQSCGLRASAVGYINAHGTGTQANDAVETAAIKQVFGEQAYRIPVSSTKSMHGHLLGGAGALEFVATVLAMEKGAIPPTANLHETDPECDLDYVPNSARAGVPIKAAMSNSFAFGGTNAVLVAARV
jgi:beta-ketoacyl-acyl-carrier-protein synthase II